MKMYLMDKLGYWHFVKDCECFCHYIFKHCHCDCNERGLSEESEIKKDLIYKIGNRLNYLTQNGIILLNQHLDIANKELTRIALTYPLGSGAWRQQKRYIDGLEYLLDAEVEQDKKKNY